MATWSLLHLTSPKNTSSGRGLVRELTQASSRGLKFTMVGADELSFTLPGNSAQTAAIGPLRDDVLAFRDDKAVQRFRVVSRVLSKDDGVLTAQFTALSYQALFDGWLFHSSDKRSWPASDSAAVREQTAIAWSIVSTAQARASSNLGITRGPAPTVSVPRTLEGAPAGDFQPRAAYYDEGAVIGNAVADLAAMDEGFEYDVLPDPAAPYTALKMMFWTVGDKGRNQFKATTTKRSELVLNDGGSLASWSHTTTPSEFANVIRMTGSIPTANYVAPGVPVWWRNGGAGTDPATPAPEGRWERDINNSDLTTNAAVSAAAPAAFAKVFSYTPELVVSLVRDKWTGPAQLWLGDMARCIITEPVTDPGAGDQWILYIDENVRVIEINVNIDDLGAEDVSLSLNRPAFSARTDDSRLYDRLARLERK